MYKFKHQKLNTEGSFIGAILIITIIITIIALSLTDLVATQYAHTKRSTFVANAELLAETGIEQSLYQLNQSSDFTGYTTPQTFFNSDIQGKGVYTTTVTDIAGSNAKTIVSVGKIYRTNNLSTPVNTKTVKVTVVGTGSDGYSVQSGPGGLILTGSANITNSDVFVNGTITLSGAAKIGTSSQPVKVDVANMACPTAGGSTYPQVCTTTQPISMSYSTNIYGSVCATGQTGYGPNPNKNIQPGTGGDGLKVGCVANPTSTPTYDRAAHIARMTTTASGTSNTYTCQSWPFNRTWPANLKLTGNVTINGSCNIVIKGDAYITGNLTIGGAAKITVDNSVGTTRPVVVVDGAISVGGSGQLIANGSGTGIQFISYKTNASCNPSCTSLTGSELKNSQGLETVTVGGAVNLPGMVFQSYWGKASISGSGNLGAAIGQTVDMSGAGTVTFGTKLSSGQRTWTITSYQQVY